MAETIDETISKLFYKAYNNDELFEYLIRSVYKELHADRKTGC